MLGASIDTSRQQRIKPSSLHVAPAFCTRHGGTLTFDTVVGKGTTFHIRLPIHQRPAASIGAGGVDPGLE